MSAASPPTPADVPEPPRDGVTGTVRHVIFGFFMGAADTVPGFSGGTVAFVCGIYARLIDAIRDGSRAGMHMLRGRVREGLRELRAVDWALLVPLLGGMFVAVLSLASALEHLLEDEPIAMSALFLGLVLGSVVTSSRMLRVHTSRTWAIVAAAAVVTFVVLGSTETTSAEAADEADAPLWAYPLSGAIAICAMILPGISGSFLLVIMGMYDDVLAAVNDRDFAVLAVFALGCVVGLAVFSRVLAWLLDRYHDIVVAAMIGLMLGSVRVLWPWPDGTESTEIHAPAGDVGIATALAIVGFVAVLVLVRLGAVREEPVPHPG